MKLISEVEVIFFNSLADGNLFGSIKPGLDCFEVGCIRKLTFSMDESFVLSLQASHCYKPFLNSLFLPLLGTYTGRPCVCLLL